MMFMCIDCFAIFFGLTTRIVPRIIPYTNIGQLMDTVQLCELLAKHCLKVKLAKLVATSTKELPKIRSLSDLSNIGEAIEAILHEPESLVDEGTSHYTGLSRNLSKKKRLKKSFSEGVSFMTASFENNQGSRLNFSLSVRLTRLTRLNGLTEATFQLQSFQSTYPVLRPFRLRTQTNVRRNVQRTL